LSGTAWSGVVPLQLFRQIVEELLYFPPKTATLYIRMSFFKVQQGLQDVSSEIGIFLFNAHDKCVA
jgi:hypothetical protein